MYKHLRNEAYIKTKNFFLLYKYNELFPLGVIKPDASKIIFNKQYLAHKFLKYLI